MLKMCGFLALILGLVPAGFAADVLAMRGYTCNLQSAGIALPPVEVQFLLYPQTYDPIRQEIKATLRRFESPVEARQVEEEMKLFALTARALPTPTTDTFVKLTERAPFTFLGRLGKLEVSLWQLNGKADSFDLYLDPVDPFDLVNSYDGTCTYDPELID